VVQKKISNPGGGSESPKKARKPRPFAEIKKIPLVVYNILQYNIYKSYHNGGRSLPVKGGVFMVIYEALIAFGTLGLLVVAIIALFKNKRKK